MTCAALPLSLVWLALLGEIDVERPRCLAAGAVLIVASNLLARFLGRRAWKTGSSADASTSS